MQSIILGIIVKQLPSTTLTVALPQPDFSATAMIALGANPFATIARINDPAGARFVVQLAPGHYVLMVDSAIRPEKADAFTVTTSAEATFWSTVHPDPFTQPRPWSLYAGTTAVVTDPKDPWPDPLTAPLGLPLAAAAPFAAAAATTLVMGSPICSRMSSLVTANAGRGPDPTIPPNKVHALLIGIDRYDAGTGQGGAYYRSLQGCVTDILETEKLLRDKVANVTITRLLAPLPGGPGDRLAIAPDEVPSYANIVAAWHRVAAAAGPDDLIYIHYSGHGGRVKTAFPDIKLGGVDEALVPCDINDRARGRYLRDVELALLLQRLADRDIKTIVVLDSCHAGGATRGDQARVRTREDGLADLEVRATDAIASAAGTGVELRTLAQALENNVTNPTWKLDASGRLTSAVTVIAACAATEAAYEYAPEGGATCGALTYFWRRALAQLRPGTTYRSAFAQVFSGVHGVFVNQSPVLLGQPDRVVLGTQVLATRPALRVSEVAGDAVTLDAGAALQIDDGATLAIVPEGQLPELVDLAGLVEVEVFDHGATTANARRIAGTGNDAPIAVGARAVVRSYPPRMQRAIRILAPSAFADTLASAIAADPTKLLAVTSNTGGDFQVIVDEATGIVELTDATGATFSRVPRTPIGGADAAGTIVKHLVHLAKYHNLQAFTNGDPGAELANLVSAELFKLDQPDAPITGVLGVAHGERFGLRLTNQSALPLTYYLLNLRPDWSIELMNPGGGVMQPGVPEIRKLRGTLLDQLDVRCRDVITVLATRTALDASLLTLAPLGGVPIRRSSRGAAESPLQALVRVMQDPLLSRRHAWLEETPSAGWTVAQVEFETTGGQRPGV